MREIRETYQRAGYVVSMFNKRGVTYIFRLTLYGFLTGGIFLIIA